MPNLVKNEKRQLAALLLLAGFFLYAGWKLFFFLTDDAFISFRYVSNSVLGYGYVWNPPPFRPVEGYSNFLWLLLLDGVWRVCHIPPPISANWLSLFFSFLSLLTGAIMVFRIDWKPSLRKYRIYFVALFLAGTLSNRTFLAWTSSGLETAMFNWLILLWFFICLYLSPRQPRWIFLLALVSAGIGLTRPDGLLFAGISGLLILSLFLLKLIPAKANFLAAASPLLLIPLHLLWRLKTYGEWLPNTYYAKVEGIWPESGIIYTLSFILEYALWIYIFLGFCLVIKNAANLTGTPAAARMVKELRNSPPVLLKFITLMTLAGQVFYYIFVVGGDHFEYRVFSHLIILLWISLIWMLNTLALRPASAILIGCIFLLCSLPVPWTHWKLSQAHITRESSRIMKIPTAASFPAPFKWYAALFDTLQFWLIDHFVCMRHQEHKIFSLWYRGIFPTREEGQLLPAADFPVMALSSVGIPAWVLPQVNIIDTLGLNDYVVARIPLKSDSPRVMAHSKMAPAGYVACFAPNTSLLPARTVAILERRKQLSAQDIRDCEYNWAARVLSENFDAGGPAYEEPNITAQ